MKKLIVYTSRSGNTESFNDWFMTKYNNITAFNLLEDDLTKLPGLLSSTEDILLGTYTWDNGKIPKEMKKFVIDNREVLMKKTRLLFGSGITIYKHFCGALDNINIILESDIPMIKFELTFLPNENGANMTIVKNILGEYK